ncbi:unnamed protein product [Notodromas monacha]|uniref:Uncharacterized protein n=1 Tax=Notodromas monacha TaxID=399045 RepID=A0A7R9BG01_9CRUS|nr:unnamed protein product [Notodromas monacha]CAG0914582.1 unnamed protein product [Notodromas monacha]
MKIAMLQMGFVSFLQSMIVEEQVQRRMAEISDETVNEKMQVESDAGKSIGQHEGITAFINEANHNFLNPLVAPGRVTREADEHKIPEFLDDAWSADVYLFEILDMRRERAGATPLRNL